MPARHTVYTIAPSPDSTLAVEIAETGLRKGKHLFVFQKFQGTLIYAPEAPLESDLSLSVDVASVICRANGETPRKQQRLTRFARDQALDADHHSHLELKSLRFDAKPLRGFIVEGVLHFRGAEHPIRANIGFGNEKNGRLQVDADSSVRLTDLGILLPTSHFGLVRTQDEAILHASMWGIASPLGY